VPEFLLFLKRRVGPRWGQRDKMGIDDIVVEVNNIKMTPGSMGCLIAAFRACDRSNKSGIMGIKPQNMSYGRTSP